MLGRALLCSLVILNGCSSPPTPATPPAGAQVSAGMPGRTTVVGRAPTGSVVALESLTAPAAVPAGPAILDQYARNFVPDLLIVRVGQTVEFRNSEDIDHNVAVIRSPTGTKVFDTSTAPYQKYEHTFSSAGRYEVSCDVHPGMRATIVATTAPHAVAVDASGRFTFADLEPGSYKLTMTGGPRPLERTIEVTGARLDLGSLAP